MKWVTRLHPKLDRIACIWLIRKLIDEQADIQYVPEHRVIPISRNEGAIAFDMSGSDYFAWGEQCLFDVFLRKHRLPDPALAVMSPIIRSMALNKPDPSPHAAGFRAVAEGLAITIPPGDELTRQGIILFEALHAWASQLPGISQPPEYSEHVLMEVFHKFVTQKYSDRVRKPMWVQEIAAIVQDQIDTNLALSLPELSRKLNANPEYLSNEFSRDFEDMTFGEYIRKKRIEKALELMEEEKYSLTEIAYMTGFSDQTHFSRIFNRHFGKTPTGHLKTIRAQKNREVAETVEEEEED
ncbi:chromate resistance protein ChrB domain-containing protein [Chitinophaga rhizosphaerae]|uniref:chromate resistance protein ChrB domain-containing protein n=1 Tax=Chitinophaga rhizosphaerae TaxID=1864947 RepID=UPI000F7FEAA9|nr:chromate resistance protein ChrB domain-containing protein [Chitinophaga rhizosphaerae]